MNVNDLLLRFIDIKSKVDLLEYDGISMVYNNCRYKMYIYSKNSLMWFRIIQSYSTTVVTNIKIGTTGIILDKNIHEMINLMEYKEDEIEYYILKNGRPNPITDNQKILEQFITLVEEEIKEKTNESCE